MNAALGRHVAFHRGTMAAGASHLASAVVFTGVSVSFFYLISRGVVSPSGVGIARKMAAVWLVCAAAHISVVVVRRLQRHLEEILMPARCVLKAAHCFRR